MELEVRWKREGELREYSALIRTAATIGRSSSCAIRLTGWGIARELALLFVMDEQWFIRDLGGFVGVYVNDQRIRDFGPLSESDQIQIANHCLRIVQPASDSKEVTIKPIESSEKPTFTNTQAIDKASEANHQAKNFEQDDESNRASDEAGACIRLHALDDKCPGPINFKPDSLNRSTALANMISWLRAAAFAELDRRGTRITDANETLDDEFESICKDLLSPEHCRNEALRALDDIERRQLIRATIDECLGLGPIQQLMDQPEVSEIMVNGADSIYIEINGRLRRAPFKFSSEQSLRQVAERIASRSGRRLDHAMPTLDARLADGSRINLVIPPLAIRGTHITIRRFSSALRNLSDLVSGNGASPVVAKFLKWAVSKRLNILVSGGTGSGKTTLLNLLASEIPDSQRVITIEDAAELQLDHPHCVSLESRLAGHEGAGTVTIRDLLRNALRMRPDRIVIGECRGGEALDLLQALNTGHGGSMSTIHANSPRDALARLEVLTLLAGLELPIDAIRAQIAAGFQIVVQTKRYPDGVRRISSVSELSGLEGGRYRMLDIFSLTGDVNRENPVYSVCSSTPHCIELLLGSAQTPWIERLSTLQDSRTSDDFRQASVESFSDSNLKVLMPEGLKHLGVEKCMSEAA